MRREVIPKSWKKIDNSSRFVKVTIAHSDIMIDICKPRAGNCYFSAIIRIN